MDKHFAYDQCTCALWSVVSLPRKLQMNNSNKMPGLKHRSVHCTAPHLPVSPSCNQIWNEAQSYFTTKCLPADILPCFCQTTWCESGGCKSCHFPFTEDKGLWFSNYFSPHYKEGREGAIGDQSYYISSSPLHFLTIHFEIFLFLTNTAPVWLKAWLRLSKNSSQKSDINAMLLFQRTSITRPVVVLIIYSH